MKLTSWLASPRNALSSVLFVGRLNSLTYFVGVYAMSADGVASEADGVPNLQFCF